MTEAERNQETVRLLCELADVFRRPLRFSASGIEGLLFSAARTIQRQEAALERVNGDARRHHGRIESFPPYIGGDDEWEAQCDCGWKAERRWDHSTGAYADVVKHLNEAHAQPTAALPPPAVEETT